MCRWKCLSDLRNVNVIKCYIYRNTSKVLTDSFGTKLTIFVCGNKYGLRLDSTSFYGKRNNSDVIHCKFVQARLVHLLLCCFSACKVTCIVLAVKYPVSSQNSVHVTFGNWFPGYVQTGRACVVCTHILGWKTGNYIKRKQDVWFNLLFEFIDSSEL